MSHNKEIITSIVRKSIGFTQVDVAGFYESEESISFTLPPVVMASRKMIRDIEHELTCELKVVGIDISSLDDAALRLVFTKL